MLSPDAPIQESWGPRFSFVERSVSSQGLVTKWTGQLGQLRPGTKYHVIVSATDAQGQSAYQTGTVQMDDRKVRITLLKIKVISDADKGSANKGEIKFDHWIGDQVFGHADFRKIGSGATINVAGTRRASGRARSARREWNRPGVQDEHRRRRVRLAADEELRSRERLDPPGQAAVRSEVRSEPTAVIRPRRRHVPSQRTARQRGSTGQVRDESSGWSRRVLCVRNDEPPPQVPGLRLPRRVLRVARPATGETLADAATCASATSGNFPRERTLRT